MSTPALMQADHDLGLSIRLLDGSDAMAFSELTAKALVWMLAADDATVLKAGLCRLGAWVDGVPAGLLLSCDAQGMQELTSIMVAKPFRMRGVAAALMVELALLMRQIGRPGIFARWSSELPRRLEFTRLIASAGWSEPTITRRRMSWRAGDWRKGFPNRDKVLQRLESRGLIVKSLLELGPDRLLDAIQQSAALVSSGRAPGWSSPEGWVRSADPRLTVMLLDEAGTVHGWMVCSHQPQFGRWYIPQGWVAADKVARGWLLGGIAAVSQRLESFCGPDALVIAQPVADAASGMEQMLFKHFGVYAVSMDLLFESQHLLGDE